MASCLRYSLDNSGCPSSDQTVHVFLEVRETHEGRRTLVLGQVTADARWVSASACVQKHAELVVVDLVGVTADVLEVILYKTDKSG